MIFEVTLNEHQYAGSVGGHARILAVIPGVDSWKRLRNTMNSRTMKNDGFFLDAVEVQQTDEGDFEQVGLILINARHVVAIRPRAEHYNIEVVND